MKKSFVFLFLSIVILAGCLLYGPPGDYGGPGYATTPGQSYPGGQDVNDYYDYLEPYGLWVSFSPYGYVWIPRDIDYGWRPYSLGHWVYTDYGWTWIAGERWGWLVHHYGRWGWDDRLGWYWVPDTVWGPSWVVWRWGNLYIGWAPIPPGYDFDRGYGFRRRDFDIPGRYWNFVRGQQFMDSRLDRWILPRERNITIINYTHIDMNIHVRDHRVINDGVAIGQVSRMTQKAVERRQVRDAGRLGESRVDSREVVMYRPDFGKAEGSRPKSAVDRDKAVQRIESNGFSGASSRGGTQAAESSVRKLQEREMKTLEKDQKAEVKAVRRSIDLDKTLSKDKTGAQTRITEVQKRHEAEKAQITQRHREEEAKVRKVQPKPKEQPEKH